MPQPFHLVRLTVAGAGFVAMAASAPHALAAQRTFVHSSPLGNDANTAFNCSLVAPCRSFNAAISVTDPGGELVILDTAGYGPMTIGQVDQGHRPVRRLRRASACSAARAHRAHPPPAS